MPEQKKPETMIPASFVYPDVEPATLARDEGEIRDVQAEAVMGGAWGTYLRRMLPPVPADPRGRAGNQAALRSPPGMADVLLGQRPAEAPDVIVGFTGHGSFWDRARREGDTLR